MMAMLKKEAIQELINITNGLFIIAIAKTKLCHELSIAASIMDTPAPVIEGES
jgi:hypothetical protein